MPQFEITAPDGTVYEIDAPEGATEAQAVELLQQRIAPAEPMFSPDGTLRVPISGRPEDDIAITPPEERTFGQDVSRGLGLGVRNIMNAAGGAADLVTLPISSILNLLGADIGPYRDVTNKAADSLGLPAPEGGLEEFGAALSEGAALGGGLAGAARAAVPLTQGVTQGVARALAATPGADIAASAGGMGGQNIAEQMDAGPVGEVAGALIGGGLGAGAAMGLPAAARRVTQSTEPSELLAAFQRQQVTPMADQVGGIGSRMASGVTRMTLGGIPLAEAAERSIATARAARDRIAASMGRISDDTGAGQAAQKGAKEFIRKTEGRAGALYDAIPIDPKRRSVLANTRQALSEMTQGMESNPELSRLVAENPRLKSFLDALTVKSEPIYAPAPVGSTDARAFSSTRQIGSTVEGGQLSWEDMKRFRSIIGEIAGRPSLTSDGNDIASMKKLYAALSEDMRATAAADGPKSLRSFERANSYWRARGNRIEQTLKSILGDDYQKAPEAAFGQIERWSREGGDAGRLARVIRSLPEDEAASVRATLFSRMGNVSAGRQDVTGTVFSPTDFATHWAKLDSRAKSALFPGVEYRQSLDDIAKIADAMKRSGEFANTSKTALAGNGIGLVTMALAGSPLAAGGIAATQATLGKLLASPRFARWLASAPKKPNGPATLAHINRLTAISTGEPTIANEVLMLQERLAQAFTSAPVRAAAEEKDDGRPEPVN